jgi:murein L,D-transpeptidase YafK
LKFEFSLLIEIADRRISVLNGSGVEVEEFPVICGRKSHEGHKLMEGDERTPRGDYYICTINEKSKFTVFYGISYPNVEDGQRGLREALISKQEMDAIGTALKDRKRPPWDTRLGGEVGIHGGGIDRDGTRGCIGMRDQDALELRRYISLGTPVNIVY